jgi:formate dehydrogenase subunit gamma
VRNQWIIPYGGALLLIAVLALGLFYWRQGPAGAPCRHRRRHRALHAFRACRALDQRHRLRACWRISGIVMAFGKFFLLPVIGGTLFGWLTYALKTAHNFVGPLFAVSLVIVIITFVQATTCQARRLAGWLSKGGGLFGGPGSAVAPLQRRREGHVLGGVHRARLVVVGSGLVLDKLVPGWARLRGEMQVAT